MTTGRINQVTIVIVHCLVDSLRSSPFRQTFTFRLPTSGSRLGDVTVLFTPSVDFTRQMNRFRQIAGSVAEASDIVPLTCRHLILLPSLF